MVLLTFWKASGEVKELIYKSWGIYAKQIQPIVLIGPYFDP